MMAKLRRRTILLVLIGPFVLEILALRISENERKITIHNPILNMGNIPDKLNSIRMFIHQSNVTTNPHTIFTKITSTTTTDMLNELTILYIDPSVSSDTDHENKCVLLNNNGTVLYNKAIIHCNWTWDKYLCWPSTPAGSIVRQKCPNLLGVINDRYAERICDFNGEWKRISKSSPDSNRNFNGWTNFSNCLKEKIWNMRKYREINLQATDKTPNSIKMLIEENPANSTTTATGAITKSILNESTVYYIEPSAIDNENKCLSLSYNETVMYTTVYCNWTWDTFLCWPSASPGSIVRQKCPSSLIGVIKEHYAERVCDFNGKWMGNPDAPVPLHNSNGWTNFSNCFRGEVWDLIKKCNKGGNCDEKYEIAKRTRILETVGLMVSFFTLLISLIIFFSFQSLRNSRTKIHKNLFIAMEIQVIIRLIIYFDQIITRPNVDDNNQSSSSGIENTPYLCEFLYFLLEYARTAMFMWMLIEGIYLHSGVTWITGARKFPYIAYAIMGWGSSLLMTAIWEFFTVKYHKGEKCLFNYNLTPYYLILEGPRHTVILLNLIFLLNIIRVLVVKLRQSHSSDLDQVRKAVRAAIVLLPLLGIAHILFYFEPTDKSVIIFAIWSYTAHFLRSFQGFFIALIYCFMNGEVRTAVARGFTIYMSLGNRSKWVPRKTSMFSGTYMAPGTEAPANNSIVKKESSPGHTTCKQTHERRNWMFCICFRNHGLRPQPTTATPESVVFELSEH